MVNIFIFIGLVPLLYIVVNNLFIARKYVVHSKGIILITGASTGIGRHAAEYLSRKYPAYLILAGVRKDTDADTISQLNIKNLSPIKIDVSSHESVVAAVEFVKETSVQSKLPLIAIVNNAGISRSSPAEYHDIGDAKRVFDTNFFGVLDLVQQTLPLLRESKGRIIMISSIAGLIGRPLSSIYTASKFALEGFSDSLRREVAAFDISVSIIEPAFVRTPIFDKIASVSTHKIEDQISKSSNDPAVIHYEQLITKSAAKKKAMVAKASEPIVTSEAIEDAAVNEYPKTRYAVANANGMPAAVGVWLSWLTPDRLEDFIMAKLF